MHKHKCINIHICAQPAASVFADVFVGVKTHLCSVHVCSCTSVHNTCSKVHATLTAKKCTCIYTHTHMHTHTLYTNTHAHPLHRRHAEALIPRLKIYAQICIHIHIHTCTNAYIFIYIHTCTYIYLYTCPHTYIHTHIYTHAYKRYIHMSARKARLKRRRGIDCAGSPTWRQEALPFSQSAAIRRGIPFVASSPIACPRGTTDKRRTTTTNNSSSHHHDSAPSRPYPLICTGAEPIHPVHGPRKLPAWPWPPETRSFFYHFGRSLHHLLWPSMIMLMIVFMTFNSSLVPLTEGLCSSNPWIWVLAF